MHIANLITPKTSLLPENPYQLAYSQHFYPYAARTRLEPVPDLATNLFQ